MQLLESHIFLLQVEQVVDGVVDSLRKACHCHFVGLVGAWLREPDIHLNTRAGGTRGQQMKIKQDTITQTESELLLFSHVCNTPEQTSNLELLHQLADGFATSSDDACVGPRVQVNILAHHFLQLGHQLLDGLTCLLHVTLVPRDHDQILGGEAQDRRKHNRGKHASLIKMKRIGTCNRGSDRRKQCEVDKEGIKSVYLSSK